MPAFTESTSAPTTPINSTWTLGGKTLTSRLLLGSAQYPSPAHLVEALTLSQTNVVTVSVRRQYPTTPSSSSHIKKSQGGQAFWEVLQPLGLHVLPNTAHCRTATEAIQTAHLARELFDTSWIKLEVIGDDYNLQPDPFALVEAAKQLVKDGFEVFPYTTDDLVLAQRLVEAGCRILMPWGAPIGTGLGLQNPYALETLRARLPNVTLIVDAGLGKPSDAARAMELGMDGVLLNTAVALAHHPPTMAVAFARAVEAGRWGYEAGLIPERSVAVPSTPVLGRPFWHEQPAL